jgi:hypothetical protein
VDAVIDEVCEAVRLRVEALALDRAGTPLPVVRARHPRQEQGAAANSQITVCPARRPHEWVHFASGGLTLHTYRVSVVAWTPGNQDNTPPEGWTPGEQGGTPAGAAPSAWEDALFLAFEGRPADLMGLDGLRDVRAETASYIDRGAFKRNWETVAVEVTAEIVRES